MYVYHCASDKHPDNVYQVSIPGGMDVSPTCPVCCGVMIYGEWGPSAITSNVGGTARALCCPIPWSRPGNAVNPLPPGASRPVVCRGERWPLAGSVP